LAEKSTSIELVFWRCSTKLLKNDPLTLRRNKKKERNRLKLI